MKYSKEKSSLLTPALSSFGEEREIHVATAKNGVFQAKDG
jgi:hypothetical protein